MKRLKILSFGTLALLAVIMTAATIAEQICGTAVARRYFYTSPAVITLWAVCAVSAAMLVWRSRMGIGARLIHAAFLLMLCGALTTHLTSVTGRLRLQSGAQPVRCLTTADSTAVALPFSISLTSNTTVYYPGTTEPADYITEVQICGNSGATVHGRISMNNVLVYDGWRFCQTAMGDGCSILTVSHDPYGIAITFSGYALLLIGMLVYFFQSQSAFRSLLRHQAWRRTACAATLSCIMLPSLASAPQTLQRGVAKSFGRLYVFHNGRIQPMQSLAYDFCRKLYGKAEYDGMTPEQVLTGWIFYYDDWKTEPMIRVKDDAMRRLLGIEGEYARLVDFYDVRGYKPATVPLEERGHAWRELDEKFRLASTVFTGKGIRIFPYTASDKSATQWLSWADTLPAEAPAEYRSYIKGSISYVAQCLHSGRNIAANAALQKIRQRQQTEAPGGALPSAARFSAELLYNRIADTLPAAAACLAAGLIFYAFAMRRIVSAEIRHTTETGRAQAPRRRSTALCSALQTMLLAAVLLWALLLLSLRGYIGGYAPFANGFETLLLMTALSACCAVAARRHTPFSQPLGLLLCGMSLLTGMMSSRNPAVGPLMPVLASPLLSIHVVVIMTAYALFALMALNGASALLLRCFSKAERRITADETVMLLSLASRQLLCPALLLLTAGIFVGAVWASQSWGAYWSWDPKETWALITMIVYAFPLHSRSMPLFRQPLFFSAWCVAAFAAVLMTYFGVNYILGGMHSYA